tara:strand:- start:2492 stop:2974 length:483 start_codon:yes stop_codon:yes gene_type:complete
MLCFHNNYYLGDKDLTYDKEAYNNWDELYADIMKEERPLVIKPLYMYDHSGITINTTGFSCKWDSGQIGYVWISPSTIDEMGTVIKDDETWIEYMKRLEGYLDGDVKVYDDYVRGDVYGFRIMNKEGEEEDSCWGFFGNDFRENGLYDHVGKDLENIDDL